METRRRDLFEEISDKYSQSKRQTRWSRSLVTMVSRPLNEQEMRQWIHGRYIRSVPRSSILRLAHHRIFSAHSVFKHLPRHVFCCLSPRGRQVLLFAILWFWGWRRCG